jgi:hypothetical protein
MRDKGQGQDYSDMDEYYNAGTREDNSMKEECCHKNELQDGRFKGEDRGQDQRAGPEVAFINNPWSRLQAESTLRPWFYFMNNCLESTLESTLRCLIDYFIKTSPLVFSDCLNKEKIRGFG